MSQLLLPALANETLCLSTLARFRRRPWTYSQPPLQRPLFQLLSLL